MSNSVEKKDLVEVYDTLWAQLKEDRELILGLYNDLKGQITTKEEYVLHGQNLGKFAEILVKQTSQLVEIVRINQKNTTKQEDLTLDDSERKDLFNQIGN